VRLSQATCLWQLIRGLRGAISRAGCPLCSRTPRCSSCTTRVRGLRGEMIVASGLPAAFADSAMFDHNSGNPRCDYHRKRIARFVRGLRSAATRTTIENKTTWITPENDLEGHDTSQRRLHWWQKTARYVKKLVASDRQKPWLAATRCATHPSDDS
jgi:hypothetical protein